jgi:hypothetical protein
MDTIITKVTGVTSEGVGFELSKPSRIKGRDGLKTKTWWVSWDLIGRQVFEGYTNLDTVKSLDDLRKPNSAPIDQPADRADKEDGR